MYSIKMPEQIIQTNKQTNKQNQPNKQVNKKQEKL